MWIISHDLLLLFFLIPSTKNTRRKKIKPMKQVVIASPKEGANTAYVPVANAITIAPMASMVRFKAVNNNKWNRPSDLWIPFKDKKRWIKTAERERIMAIVSVIINA
ncbi:hypothetical protein Patl1_21621 [Pistacia atlantica]|uniref:Uncharacterized protein n=1 Tax=Pistacia atlantica TaxID=434234 RepID=A0ACC1BMY3_9ROSI|nr:hypothetical protein Patl1_21621 [Pistacia atlantica]